MLKSAAKKVMWVGKATVFAVGLAVVLALTVGVASTALAGTGIGARFDLGKTNTVNQISKLVGSVAGPSLQIDNNSAEAGATALDLQVESGKSPITVNSDAKVANLNADKLDGTDSTGFVQSVKPMKVVAAGQVRADGGVMTQNSNVVGVTKSFTGFYVIEIAGITDYSFGNYVAIATAIGSDGRVAQTSVVGGGRDAKLTVAIRDVNGAFVDGPFSFVVYDPAP